MKAPIKKILQLFFTLIIALQFACQKKSEDSKEEVFFPSVTTSKYLYVSSGACYSGGGNTTFTAATSSNLIYRLRLDSGVKDMTLADFNSAPASSGDSPIAIVDSGSTHLLALIETTSGRRIEKFLKSAQPTRSTFSTNSTALSAVLRAMIPTLDGGIIVSKSSAIEKFNNLGQRLTIGASSPWVNAPGGSCASSATLISSIQQLSNGKIIFTHAAASQNKIGLISAAGYTVTADCLAAQSAPSVSSFPTASVYIESANQLIVAYAGNTTTTDINSIYVYDINETTNAISNATKLLDANTSNYIYGISAMAYDSDNSYLYVATANSFSTAITNYNIERFSYNSGTKTLTRKGSTPFYTYGFDTKCISSMIITY